MKTEKKYLDLYYKLLENPKEYGLDNGLCDIFGYTIGPIDPLFKLMTPFSDNPEEIPDDPEADFAYWASGEKIWNKPIEDPSFGTEFTPLRQNIVLFMAAMNGEL